MARELKRKVAPRVTQSFACSLSNKNALSNPSFEMSLQSKTVCAKSVQPPDLVFSFLDGAFPSARTVASLHPAEGLTPAHYHYVIMFDSVTRWDKLRNWFMTVDPHSYSDSCRSVVRALRYLCHLDNPEKVRVDVSSLLYHNVDSSAIEPYMTCSSQRSINDHLGKLLSLGPIEALRYCETKGLPLNKVRLAMDFMSSHRRMRDVFAPSDFAEPVSNGSECFEGMPLNGMECFEGMSLNGMEGFEGMSLNGMEGPEEIEMLGGDYGNF